MEQLRDWKYVNKYSTNSDKQAAYHLLGALRAYEGKLGYTDKLLMTFDEFRTFVDTTSHDIVIFFNSDSDNPQEAIGLIIYHAYLNTYEGITETFIDELYITESERNKGLGTKIIEWLKERDGVHIVLNVLDNNENTIAFYKKNGFKITGLIQMET